MDPLFLLLVGIVIVVGSILLWRLHAFLALILGALAVGALTPRASIEEYHRSQGVSAEEAHELSVKPVGSRVAAGFGANCAKIGIVIALAAIIGRCLLESGAADRIVRSALKLVGEVRAGAAFLGSGFLLGIPVFFDTVFYLMIPLGKALALRMGGNYLFYILTITAGATMAHSLVPPTPGPLFVAESLEIDLGVMILAGSAVGAVTVTCGYFWARWVSRRWQVPLRDSVDFSRAELEALSQRPDSELPPLWLSVCPVLLPVGLIAGGTVVEAMAKNGWVDIGGGFARTFLALGDKNIALGLAAAIALVTVVRQRGTGRDGLAKSVQVALQSGGVIILITAAGGAFGRILQETGIGGRIEALADTVKIGILPLAFAFTTLIRTAQGSATVAMMTSTGVLAGAIDPATLGYHPVYIALAIGCGSKPIAWMNDSGFWVICKMSGMTEAEGLKFITPLSAMMGVVGLGVVALGSWLFPLV